MFQFPVKPVEEIMVVALTPPVQIGQDRKYGVNTP
jgi:hypothetical protein